MKKEKVIVKNCDTCNHSRVGGHSFRGNCTKCDNNYSNWV